MSAVHGYGPLQDLLPQWAHTLHSTTTHAVTEEYLLAQGVEKQGNCTNCKLDKSIRANLNVSAYVFLTRWCQAWRPWGWPRDGEHGIRLWPLPGAHSRQQDQLQRVWRLWPVLWLLQCKEVSRQVTHFKFNLMLLKHTYFLVVYLRVITLIIFQRSHL